MLDYLGNERKILSHSNLEIKFFWKSYGYS